MRIARLIATGAAALVLSVVALQLPAGTGDAKPCNPHKPGCVPSPSPSPSPSTTPPPACTGVQVSPTDSLSLVVAANPEGTTFCLEAGTHHPAPVLAKRLDRFIGAGQGATVLDFGGLATSDGYCLYGYSTYQTDVEVADLTVTACGGTAVKTAHRWSVHDVEISGSPKGILLADGVVADHMWIHHNATFGVTGAAGTIQDSEVSFNGGVPESGSHGGSKHVGDGNVSWIGNNVHDNLGDAAIWFDGHEGDAIVQGNTIMNNAGIGIDFEISWHGNQTASGNTLVGNASSSVGQSCFWGAQISVQNSEGVSVTGNTIDSSNGANALCVVDTDRPSNQYPAWPENVEPFLAEANTIVLGGTAQVGEVGTDYPHTPASVPFRANVYQGDVAGAHWVWLSSNPMSLPAWQALGQQ